MFLRALDGLRSTCPIEGGLTSDPTSALTSYWASDLSSDLTSHWTSMSQRDYPECIKRTLVAQVLARRPIAEEVGAIY